MTGNAPVHPNSNAPTNLLRSGPTEPNYNIYQGCLVTTTAL
jgi:hypothetical protein